MTDCKSVQQKDRGKLPVTDLLQKGRVVIVRAMPVS